MMGLRVEDEMFAVKLLELARALEPTGNRVKFVEDCEINAVRGFLETFPAVWDRITDRPLREGVEPAESYCGRWQLQRSLCLKTQEQLHQGLAQAGLRSLVFQGPNLDCSFYQDQVCEFSQIGCLVSPSDLGAVEQRMQDLGFQALAIDGLTADQQEAQRVFGYSQTYSNSPGTVCVELRWRLYSPWLGMDLVEFEELWSRRKLVKESPQASTWGLGDADTVVFLALENTSSGWLQLKDLLDVTVALEVLDYTWSEVLAIAGYRVVLLERAVELCVRLLGVSHPKNMTYHYRDDFHALHEFLLAGTLDSAPFWLLGPTTWSCPSSESVARSIKALTHPSRADISRTSFSPQWFLFYRLLRCWSLLMSPTSPSD